MKTQNWIGTRLGKYLRLPTVCCLAALVLPAAAADRWWDGGSVNISGLGDGVSAGTAGLWDATTANWDQGAGVPHAAWNNANNDTANFAGTAGTVNLGAGIVVNGLVFNTGTYILTNANTLTFAGVAPTITANATTTIGSGTATVLAGTAGLIKSGTGNLTLSGSAVHTFTGNLTLNLGTLTLNYGNLATPTDLINSGNNLVLGGGTLVLTGKASTPSSQTFGNLTINPGSTTIRSTGGASSTMSLTLGNVWTRNPGGVLNFTNGIGATAGTVTSSPSLVNNIIGTWATFGPGAGTMYATVSGGVIAGLTGTAAADGSGLTDTTGTVNYDLAAGGGTVADPFSANTIRYTGAANSIAPGASFMVNGLLNAGTGLWTIGTGSVTIGADRELVVNSANNAITISGVIQDNPGGASGLTVTGTGALTLNTANTFTGTNMLNGTFSLGDGVKTIIVTSLKNAGNNSELGAGSWIVLNGAVIQTSASGNSTSDRSLKIAGNGGILVKGNLIQTNTGPITGSGTFSVDGDFGASGKLVLAGNNSFTGDLVFQADGRLTVNSVNALSMASLNMSGARIAADLSTYNLAYVLGGLKGNQSLVLGTGLGGGGSGFVSVGNNSQNSGYAGVLSGAAGLIKLGAGTQTFYAPNQYTGDTKINAGTLRLEGVTALALTCTVGGSGANLNKQLTSLSSTATMFVGQAVSGVNIGLGATIASIDSATQVTLSVAGTAGATTATFAAHAGAIGGSTNMILAGAGTLDVTSLSGGLVLNASQTLGGNGTVSGDLSVANASIVSPGASIGTLTNSGNVTWQGGGIYKWEISGTNAGGQDLLLITGALTNQANSGNKFKINVVSLNGSGQPGPLAGSFNPNMNQKWKIATAAGGLVNFTSDAFTCIDNFTASNGASGSLSVTNIGNDVFVAYQTAFVPEPPSAGAPTPASATKWVGDSVTFTIVPTGTGPLTNQWRFNGTALPGQTDASLTLTNLQLTQSGTYDCVVSGPYPPASISSGVSLTVNRLVVNASYRFGEDGTGANNLPKDSSGYGHDFVSEVNGASVTVSASAPAPGSTNCYVLNGTAGFSSIGWDPPEDNIGVECWVRVADLAQGAAQVLGTGSSGLNGLNLIFSGGTGLRAVASFSGSDANVGSAYLPGSPDEWVHIAVVRAGGVATFYVNGLASGPTYSGTPVDSTTPYLGRANLNRFFNGGIDEARIFTFAPGQFRSSDLGFYQTTPFVVTHPKPYFNPAATGSFYLQSKDFVTYSGWGDLWYRYRGQLPFGAGVSVAQVESFVPAITNFPDKHFTLNPPDAVPDSAAHADTVGNIFYGSGIFQDANAIFEKGFGRGITNIAAYTTEAFRTNVLHIVPFNVRDGSLPAWNNGRQDVMSTSSSMGFAGEDNTIRAFDYLIDAENVLACNAFPNSADGSVNAFLSGNLWNAVVVGMNAPTEAAAGGAQYENVGSNFRSKPDLVSASTSGRDGGATSWATPTVASAAALLLEAARSTNSTANATNNYVLKSILLAGTSKSGLVSPVWDYTGTTIVAWDYATPYVYSNNPPSQPLDHFYGAGLFNLNNAYTLLMAGEQSGAVTNQSIGWVRGSGLNSSAAHTYWFAVSHAEPEFCATLVWNRHVQDVAGTSYNWSVTDLKLELYDAANQLLASSDDPGNNVEQVYLAQGLAAGRYYLKVSSHDAAGENYGLAWRTSVPSGDPVVALASPATGQSLSASAPISLTASVMANNHNLSQVRYYADGTLLGSSVSGPAFLVAWSNAVPGSYSLTAVLSYDSSLSVTSAPVSVAVVTPIIITGQAKVAEGTFQLTFTGTSGQAYRVLSTNDLTAPLISWPAISSGTIDPSGTVIYTDTAATNHQQYYLIVSP